MPRGRGSGSKRGGGHDTGGKGAKPGRKGGAGLRLGGKKRGRKPGAKKMVEAEQQVSRADADKAVRQTIKNFDGGRSDDIHLPSGVLKACNLSLISGLRASAERQLENFKNEHAAEIERARYVKNLPPKLRAPRQRLSKKVTRLRFLEGLKKKVRGPREPLRKVEASQAAREMRQAVEGYARGLVSGEKEMFHIDGGLLKGIAGTDLLALRDSAANGLKALESVPPTAANATRKRFLRECIGTYKSLIGMKERFG